MLFSPVSRFRPVRMLATPFPLTAWLAGWFLLLHTGIRLVLMGQTWHAAQMTVASAAKVLGTGLVFDLVTLGLALPALMLLESALGTRKSAGRTRRGLVLAIAGISLFALGFGVMAEWFFWDEFGVRFNFIAVDYLVYTHEVIGNIRESFPVGTLLSTLAVITLALVWHQRAWLQRAAAPLVSRRSRVGLWLASLVMAIGLSSVWSMDARRGNNEYQLELSANGLYCLGYAFGNNEIDYFDFYATRPQEVNAPLAELPRIVTATAPRNVVIITLESLSSSYMAHGGNTLNITPQLDRLATQGPVSLQPARHRQPHGAWSGSHLTGNSAPARPLGDLARQQPEPGNAGRRTGRSRLCESLHVRRLCALRQHGHLLRRQSLPTSRSRPVP